MGHHFLPLLLLSVLCSRSLASNTVSAVDKGLVEATPSQTNLKTSGSELLEATQKMAPHISASGTWDNKAPASSSPRQAELGKLEATAQVSAVYPTSESAERMSIVHVYPTSESAETMSTVHVYPTSESAERMSNVHGVDGSASSVDTGSKITIKTPTRFDSSTASQTPDMTTMAPKVKGDVGRRPAIDSDSIKPSATAAETSSGLTTDNAMTVTQQTKGGDKTFGKSTPTSRSDDRTTQDTDLNSDGSDDSEVAAKPTPSQKPKSDKKDAYLAAIVIVMIILVVLFFGIIFLLIRKKKRSGSFRTQSKKSRQDVWAGQVPELGDGKAAQDPAAVENGTARPITEVELTTFASSEKKEDSVNEINELVGGGVAKENGGENLAKEDPDKEQAPMLEETSTESQEPDDKKEDQFSVPPEEQQLLGNGV